MKVLVILVLLSNKGRLLMTRQARRLVQILFCVVGIFALAVPASQAQDRGLAWRIALDGVEAYAVGALHLADQSFYPLNPNIISAFDKSDVLLVEVDDLLVTTEHKQALLQKYAFYPNNEDIYGHLPEQIIDQIRAMLASFGLNIDMVKNYRPGMIGVTLSALQAQALGYSAQYGLDAYFLDRARYKKKIQEIETFESQMQLLAELPSGEQVLRDAFFDMADYEHTWSVMMNSWKRGDAKALYQVAIGDALQDFPSLAPYYEMLFFERNVTMAQALKGCMKQAQCFMVVGAGHLVGPRGLLDLMEQEGAKITQLD
jgi:uncharacterized protein